MTELPKKVFQVTSEADMEKAIKTLIKIAKSKAKKKVLNLWFPNEKLSDIFLENAYKEAKEASVPDDSGLNLNIYIEGPENDGTKTK